MMDHVDHIMEVMEAAFDPAYGEAWNRRQITTSLLTPNTFAILGDEKGDDPQENVPVAGFAISRFILDEEELLLLAVRPNMRGKGIGSKILARFIAESKKRGSNHLFLEMRDGNKAENLYLSAGFEKVGIRKDYYRSGVEGPFDAITFSLNTPFA